MDSDEHTKIPALTSDIANMLSAIRHLGATVEAPVMRGTETWAPAPLGFGQRLSAPRS